MVDVKNYLKNPLLYATIISIVCIYSGLLAVPNYTTIQSLIPQDHIVSITGTVVSSPAIIHSQSRLSSYRAIVQVQGVTADTGITSTARGETSVFFSAESIESFYPGKLYTQNTQSKPALIDSGCQLTIHGSYKDDVFIARSYQVTTPTGYSSKIARIRALCRLYLRRMLYSWGQAGGFLLACIQGSREYLDTDISEAFTQTGLAHILALSGMHLLLLSSFVRFWGNKISKQAGMIATIGIILLFTWFAGVTPSLLRACIFSLILLAFSMAGFVQPSLFLVLCVTFLIQVTIQPQHATQVSFLLSYAALAGIFIVSPHCNRFLVRYLPPQLANALSASIGAQLYSTPITLHYFGTYAPIGIIASIVIAPLVTLFLYIGILGILLYLVFPYTAVVCTPVIQGIYALIQGIVFFFSHTYTF